MTEAALPKWAKALFDQQARYIAIRGGRGSGKSRSVATALVLRAAQTPLRILCAREIQKSIRDSVKRLLDDEIDRLALKSFFQSTDTEIRGANGSLFLFAGLRTNIESIKSMEGLDIAWVEEAQTVSQASLDILIPTVRNPGSQIWFTWNPNRDTDPVDSMFVRVDPPPSSVVLRVNWDQNPWFPDVLRAEMEYDRSRDPEKYAHVWEGEYVQHSEARVFKNWRIEPFETPPDAIHRMGADFGFAVDPTVLVRCHVVGRKLFVDWEAYQVGCEVVDTPALFMTVPEAEKWPIVADSSRPETISHLRKNGFPKIMPAVKGAKSVEEGVEFLKSYDIVVHPRCQHLIDELTHYSYKLDPLTGAVLPVLEDKHNHCIAEGQLVLTARGNVPIESITTDDLVWTRGGWQRVLFADVTDVNRQTVIVKTTQGEVVCTPDHEIWTSRGFIRADALRYNDDILEVECSPWLQSRLSNGEERSGGDILTRHTQVRGITSSESRRFFTGLFGNLSTGLSRQGSTYTTLTETLATIASRIWSALTPKTTHSATSGAQNASPNKPSIWRKYAHSQRLGTAAQRAWRSIVRLAVWLMPTSYQQPSYARVAASSFFHGRLATETSSAAMPASLNTGAKLERMTSNESAFNVSSPLPSTNTAVPKLAAGRVLTVTSGPMSERVYDLTVDQHHEFVCGGILVSNCLDALRYSLEAVRRVQAQKPVSFVALPTSHRW